MKSSFLKSVFAVLALSAMAVPASALSYTIEGANVEMTAAPTSISASMPAAGSEADLSKDAALIPPFFGSAESYLPNRSEGLVSSSSGTSQTGSSSSVIYPEGSSSGSGSYYATRFTAISDDDYYSDGRIGRLSIPALDVNAKIYEGTTSSNMSKGIAHFSESSIWDGNVALAAHNRGSTDLFKNIHKLNVGDQITLTTKNGSRTYSVSSVSKVKESDTSCVERTYDNVLTLVTCVKNEREYRYVVRATQV